MAELGGRAPDFTLYDTGKEKRTLSDYRGRNIVLAFFPAAFSGICDREMCVFRDAMQELNSLDATVVGISVDGPHANRAFAEKYGLQFPLLTDIHRSAVDAYGVAFHDFAGIPGYTVAERAIFILDRDGVIRFRWIADNPGQEPDYARINEELASIA